MRVFLCFFVHYRPLISCCSHIHLGAQLGAYLISVGIGMVAIKQAKPKEKTYRMADGGGMYLEIMPNGSKYWRLKYRYGGKGKRLAFGVYPVVSLASACEKCRLARAELLEGFDPDEVKKTR